MSETLQDFLIRRAREIDIASASLWAQLSELEDERAQIDKAAAAAGVVIGHASEQDGQTYAEQASLAGGADRAGSKSARRAPEATIKEAVLAILADAGRGMTALEILPAVNARLGIDYPRTSLSPQLSRLKADGKLDRNGHVWSLVSEAEDQTEKAPDAQAPEAFQTPRWLSQEPASDPFARD